MASYVVCEGRLVKDQDIRRGTMLVREEIEQKIKNGISSSNVNRERGIPIFVVTVALILSMLVIPDGTGWDRLESVIILLYLVLIFGFMFYMMLGSRALLKEPVPGLYETGLQVDNRMFIPYDEIASAKRRGKIVEMYHRHRHDEPLWSRNKDPWTIRFDVLDEDGLDELERRVRSRDLSKKNNNIPDQT